mgnify:CR=1 FL=1
MLLTQVRTEHQRSAKSSSLLTIGTAEFVDTADLVLHFDKQGTVTSEKGLGRVAAVIEDEPASDATPSTHKATNDIPREEEMEEENPELVEIAAALEDAHHRGDWNGWLFFYKQMPTWAVVPFLLVTVIDTICEKITCELKAFKESRLVGGILIFCLAIYMRIWIDQYPDSKSLFAGYVAIGFASTIAYVAMAVYVLIHERPMARTNNSQTIFPNHFAAICQ